MVKYLGQKNHDIALYKVFFVVDKKDRGIKIMLRYIQSLVGY